jgi:dynactin 1
MEDAKKLADQTAKETLSKLQTQEQNYAEALENLRTECETLEKENASLRNNAAKKEEKRPSTPKKTDFDLLEDTSSTMIQENTNLFEINSHLESLKSAIRYLRAENAHLKGSDIIRSLQLDEVPKPVLVDPQVKAMMRSFALETRMLVKDMRTASATPKVIQLSADRRGGKWHSDKRLPDYQYQTQQSVLYTLKQRCDQLKDKMAQAQKDRQQVLAIQPILDKVTTNVLY